MPLYTIFKVINGDPLFKRSLHSEDAKGKAIGYSRITNFVIKNKADYIFCSGRDEIQSRFSETELLEGMLINIIIRSSKFIYALVGLSGDGLKSLRNPKKYINDNIFSYLKEHLKEKYDIPIDFISFDYENKHFSPDFWGKEITSKYGYYSDDDMFIRVKSQNLEKFLEIDKKKDMKTTKKTENKLYSELMEFYSRGIVMSISGKDKDLALISDTKKYSGTFRFNREGLIHSNLPDIFIFDTFVQNRLMENGFFEVK
jgi:hypothetical protein